MLKTSVKGRMVPFSLNVIKNERAIWPFIYLSVNNVHVYMTKMHVNNSQNSGKPPLSNSGFSVAKLIIINLNKNVRVL